MHRRLRLRTASVVVFACLAGVLGGCELKSLGYLTAGDHDEGGPGGTGGNGGGAYAQAVLADKPILYLRFGETGGTVAHDEIRSTNDGTYSPTGILLGQPGALEGDANTAIHVDGATYTGITMPAGSANFAAGTCSFTLELWIKPDSQDASAQGLSFVLDHYRWTGGATGSRVGYDIDISAGLLRTAVYWNDGNSFYPTQIDGGNDGVPSASVWHYYAAVCSQSALSIFIDNQLVATGNAGTGIQMTPIGVPWSIGTQNCGGCGSSFAGGLDELAIYDTPLSTDRLQAHFQAAQ